MSTIIKKSFLILSVLTLLFCFVGCDQNLEKNKYEEDVSIDVAAEPTSLTALEEEITKIAYTYDDGGILTEALAVFKGDTEIGEQKGEIFFTFCREDEENERGTIVIVTYSMFDKKVTHVSYEQGNGKFTATSKEPILKEAKLVTFDSLFDMLRADPNMGKKLAGANIKLSIEFTSTGFTPSLI